MGKNENSELHGFFYGIFWGALIGVACGLLIAPKTGEDTRNDVKIKAQELSEVFGKLFEEGNSLIDVLSSKVSNFTTGENAIQKKLDQLKSEIERLKVSAD